MLAYRLLSFLSEKRVILLISGLYYICQAVGISIFSMLTAKIPTIAEVRVLPVYISIALVLCTGVAVFVSSFSIIILAGALINIFIGVLCAYCLTKLAFETTQGRRGLVFGIAYAVSKIGAWLLSLPMNGEFFRCKECFFVFTIIVAVTLLLLRYLLPVSNKAINTGSKYLVFNKKIVWLALAVIFLMWLESTLGYAFSLKNEPDIISKQLNYSHSFYALGLIAAGIVHDKSRRWGAICSLAALSFPFAAIALGENATFINVIWILVFLFTGFMAAYRTIVFVDMSDNMAFPAIAPLGLMAGRIGEAVGIYSVSLLGDASLIVVATIVFTLSIVLFMPLYQKQYIVATSAEELEKQRFEAYVTRNGLSIREQEIFALVIQNLSNAQIAAELCITESTVKFHVGNILKKTGFNNRAELLADYRLRNGNLMDIK